MGRSPKNVQGERGGCKGGFLQTTVGTEAGDDLSDPHSCRVLRDPRPEVDAFLLAHPHHKDKGTAGPGGFHSPLSDSCPVLAGTFLRKHLFYNETLSSFPGRLHCLLSHSPFVLGLSDTGRPGAVPGTSSQTAQLPGRPGQHPVGPRWEPAFVCRSPLNREPTGTCNRGLGRAPSRWPTGPLSIRRAGAQQLRGCPRKISTATPERTGKAFGAPNKVTPKVKQKLESPEVFCGTGRARAGPSGPG